MDDFEGFKTSVEEVTADVVETGRETELEVELEGGTELMQSYDKTLTDEEYGWTKKGLLEIESTPGKDAGKTVDAINNQGGGAVGEGWFGSWGLAVANYYI